VPRQALTINAANVHQALQLDDDAFGVRHDRHALFPAGPFMAGSSLRAMNNILDADGAVSSEGPQRQRRTCAAG